MCFFAEVLELLKGIHVLLGGHPGENLQCLQFAALAIDDLLVGGSLAPFRGSLDRLHAGGDFIVHVLRHNGHFLNDLLLVEKLREPFLKFLVVGVE